MAHYLNNHTFFHRILEEYIRYGRLIIAADFDETIYNNWREEPNYDICDLLKRWQPYADIIVWTCRSPEDYSFIMQICKGAGFIPDHINEESDIANLDTRKIFANAVLDDRAGLKQVYEDLSELIEMIEKGEI